jgi:hypothetical protein
MAEWLVGTGQTYLYISEALAVASNGDTITITDSRTYLESWIMLNKTGISLRSNKTNPDQFPVLKIFMDSNTLNLINNWVFSFVRIEPNGASRFTFNLQTVSFRSCVFCNYDYLLACDCVSNRIKKFQSCLFYNFSDYVFNAQQNFDSQALVISNCTFHNCAAIFKNDFSNEMMAQQPQVSNCIFTDCMNFAPQVQDDVPPNGRKYRLFQQIRYCTFSNNPQTANATFGTGCYVNESAANIYREALKEFPTQFSIKDNLKIRNSGNDTLGFTPDLSGTTRISPFDRGAWEYEGGPGNVKKILPFINYQGVP